MLDNKILRDDLPAVAKMIQQRRIKNIDLDKFQALESDRKILQKDVEDLQNVRNKQSKSIGIAKAQGDTTLADQLMAEVSGIGEDLKAKQDQLNILQSELRIFYLQLPNILHKDIPEGADETANVEIRKWGEPGRFDFTPKDHVDLGRGYGIDMDAGVKLSGSRFVVLRDKTARLHRALAQFMLDLHTQEHGYMEVNVPYLVGTHALECTGQMPNLEDDLFFCNTDSDNENSSKRLGLIPTSEVSLTNLVRDEILDYKELPYKFTAHSACFRKEAGSYGKDTRGMIRVHQFEKVELVNIAAAEQSFQCLEDMVYSAERVLQLLELPYRVVELCSGDIGFCAAKTYDIEVWLPSEDTYREISSCSNCTDFQARRLKARTKNNNKTELVHTLNGSGVAVGRALVAVLENYQQADGTIKVPEVLKKYMGGVEVI